MILIIGGYCQGKTQYMKSLPQYGGLQGRNPDRKEEVPSADGMISDLEQAWNLPVILRFHHYVKRLADESQIQELISRILKENPDVLITMDEVGCGIVPMESEDRSYRELAGLAGQRLAKEAKEVHRVCCGIGSRIK